MLFLRSNNNFSKSRFGNERFKNLDDEKTTSPGVKSNFPPYDDKNFFSSIVALGNPFAVYSNPFAK